MKTHTTLTREEVEEIYEKFPSLSRDTQEQFLFVVRCLVNHPDDARVIALVDSCNDERPSFEERYNLLREYFPEDVED